MCVISGGSYLSELISGCLVPQAQVSFEKVEEKTGCKDPGRSCGMAAVGNPRFATASAYFRRQSSEGLGPGGPNPAAPDMFKLPCF